jgi:hypothetical protein
MTIKLIKARERSNMKISRQFTIPFREHVKTPAYGEEETKKLPLGLVRIIFAFWFFLVRILHMDAWGK